MCCYTKAVFLPDPQKAKDSEISASTENEKSTGKHVY